MPVRLPASTSAPAGPEPILAQPQPDVVATQAPASDASKPKRRTKKELIAAAEVPADGVVFEMKDGATGEKIQRAWPDAAKLFLAKSASFVDTGDRYKAWRWEELQGDQPAAPQQGMQQQAAQTIPALEHRWTNLQVRLDNAEPGSEEFSQLQEEANMVREEIVKAGGLDPESDEAYLNRNLGGREARVSPDGSCYVLAPKEQQDSVNDDSVLVTNIHGDHLGVVERVVWESWALHVVSGAETGKKDEGSVPPEAQPGDEVRLGGEVYRVGHGGVLTSGPIEVDGKIVGPARTWQRELGSGGKGKWEVVAVHQQAQQTPNTTGAVNADLFGATASTVTPEDERVETKLDAEIDQARDGAMKDRLEARHEAEAPLYQRLATSDFEQVGLNVWKVGSGLLEKIGLPEYSSLQIGPIAASRQIVVTSDDRVSITREDGSVVSAPREVVEGIVECGHAVEISARILRSEALSFIAAAKPGTVVQQ